MFFPGDALCASLGTPPPDVLKPPNPVGRPFTLHDIAGSDQSCGAGVGVCVSKTCSCNTGKGMPVEPDPVSVADFPTTQQLQDMVEKECIDQSKPWSGSICLPCTPAKETDPTSVLNEPDPIDICTYLAGQKSASIVGLYFSTTEFPPPANPKDAFKKEDSVWPRLKHKIERESYQCGSPVVVGKGSSNRSFVCQICNKTNKKNRSTKRTDVDYRQTHLTNDGERGERENGRALPRRTSTQDVSHNTCSFRFTIKCDEKGYFITLRRGGGCPTHTGHPRYNTSEIPFPPRLMTEEEKKDLKNLHKTSCGNGVCSAYLLSKLGRLVPRSKIAYFADAEDLPKDKSLEKFDGDIDKMIRYFETDDQTAYSVLWDVPTYERKANPANTENANGSTSKSKGAPTGTSLVSQFKDADTGASTVKDVSRDPQMSKVAAMAKDDRESRSISNDKNLFLAIAWTIKGKILSIVLLLITISWFISNF